jgi:hypothetical protein
MDYGVSNLTIAIHIEACYRAICQTACPFRKDIIITATLTISQLMCMDNHGVLEVLKTLYDMAPCIMVEDYRHFGRTYCLHLQGRRERQTSNREPARSKQ